MRILIATDGSEYSKAAIEEACRNIVCAKDAHVLVVSAYEDAYPITAEPFALSAEYYQKLDEAVRFQAENFVDAAQRMIKEVLPGEVTVESEILKGPPDQQIIERAKEWNADLIVVGSHGRGFWGRLLGSVSNAVVHHAPCSVLVVRKR